MGIFTDLFESGQALRNWLNTAGQDFLLEFDTGSEALQTLRNEGGHIRTQDFYDLYNSVWERYRQSDEFEFLDKNQLIPIADHISDHGWDLSTNFLYRFQIEGYDPVEKQTVTRYMAVGSDRQLSEVEAREMLDSLILGEEQFYALEPETFTLDGAYVRPEVANRL